jgi:hypothetical protein
MRPPMPCGLIATRGQRDAGKLLRGVSTCSNWLRYSDYSKGAVCTLIIPFGLTGPATITGVIDCAGAYVCACISPLDFLGTSRSLLLRCRGVVSGLFGCSRSAIANNSLTDIKSSSLSLETIQHELVLL